MRLAQTLNCGILLLSLSGLAACGGGGGGGGVIPGITTGVPTGNPSTIDAGTSGSGSSGSGASAGNSATGTSANPLAAPLSAGVTLNGSSGQFPASGSFPVSYAARSADGAPLSGHDGMAIFTTNGSTTSVQIVIPSLNINTTLVPDYAQGLAQQNRDPVDWGIDPAGGLSALSYMVLGYWLASPSPNDGVNAKQLVFGIDTPAASMPVAGTATFTGGAQGFLTTNQYYPSLQGAASLTVDFAAGSITGALTKMQVLCGCGSAAPTPWNDVSISASIAAGTNRFTGNTAVTSAPGTPLSLAPSATGRIDGGFFGPAAQSLGAAWTLSDGTASAVGTIYAGH